MFLAGRELTVPIKPSTPFYPLVPFFLRYNIPLKEERDLALDRLQQICDAQFISVLDFVNNPLRIFAAHELAAIIDPAMTVKMTVQFNLFGGTVLKLGTKKHHDQYLKGIDTLHVRARPSMAPRNSDILFSLFFFLTGRGMLRADRVRLRQ